MCLKVHLTDAARAKITHNLLWGILADMQVVWKVNAFFFGGLLHKMAILVKKEEL